MPWRSDNGSMVAVGLTVTGWVDSAVGSPVLAGSGVLETNVARVGVGSTTVAVGAKVGAGVSIGREVTATVAVMLGVGAKSAFDGRPLALHPASTRTDIKAHIPTSAQFSLLVLCIVLGFDSRPGVLCSSLVTGLARASLCARAGSHIYLSKAQDVP